MVDDGANVFVRGDLFDYLVVNYEGGVQWDGCGGSEWSFLWCRRNCLDLNASKTRGRMSPVQFVAVQLCLWCP